MDVDGGNLDEMWSARCSVSSSAGSLRDAGDELDGQSMAAEEDKMFVAVAEDISRWGQKVHCTSMKPEEISEYLKLVREKAEKNLDEYALIAKSTRKDLEIDWEKVIIDMHDVAKGLEELIALRGSTKLVMGAAADQY
ncbi:hypothetical protein E2562_039177 [Oryza meyeriana var. granulata]|uniref:Uncharacterized protein n=1 Tax=Oryza meyeriana var. granulata TaxID=110450 RepID=A0A6G1DUG8_9ORYZ|nr:hypothetical protein E2562_039177 [Oryza meyeriana var. granulata]